MDRQAGDSSGIIAVIPARGGSKGLPGKNIRSFIGHPLLAYSIAAALQSNRIDRTIVSTDDEQIARTARQYGAEVPFLRPEHLAQDDTLDLPVFQHALRWLEEHENYQPEIVVQLRPTSPVRPPDCVDRAVEMLLTDPRADSVRGVVPSSQNPFKMWRIGDEGYLDALLANEFDEPYNMPRQKLPATYWQTGHIDAIRSKSIVEKKSMTGDMVLPLVLDVRFTIDIDTDRDWEYAERMISKFDLPYVIPGRIRRPFPEEVKLVVLDFDGVLTDDRVWVDGDGKEMVAANRGDGMGISRLLDAGIEVFVLSTETDPVVKARCGKLGIDAIQGLGDKAATLEKIIADRELESSNVVYLGNDINDLTCFPLVGCALVPADAHVDAKRKADIRLTKRGGHGAVRELCDMILDKWKG
ncbi:MAG: acylneuraminate cytidylyltransferase [Anaerolineales bacterium]|jgi:N-acylneuraminate cytidylyltransferase